MRPFRRGQNQDRLTSPVRLFLLILFLICVCEAAIMAIFAAVDAEPAAAIVADSILLAVLVTPLLYQFVLRPLREAQEALADSNRRLEALHTVDQRQLANLYQISKAVGSSLELDVVLRTVLQHAVAHLDASYGSILVMDSANDLGKGRAQVFRMIDEQSGTQLQASAEEFDRDMAARVQQTRRPVLVPDGGISKGLVPRTWVRSAVGTPLLIGDGLMGSIQIARTEACQPPFQEEDLAFLTAVARQASVAVHNSRLYQAERDHSSQLERTRKQLDRLLDRVLTTQEQERRRVALDLHDGPLQRTAAVLRKLEYVEALLGGRAPQVLAEVSRLKREVRDGLTEMRRVVSDLRPALLDELGFTAAVRQYIRDSGRGSDMTYQVEVRGEEQEMEGRRATNLFRILQECLSNVRKHANAKHVSVQLIYATDSFRMIVEDDGDGFAVSEAEDVGANGQHLGVLGMQERAMMLGGSLRVKSAPGAGTTVSLEIPLTPVHDPRALKERETPA